MLQTSPAPPAASPVQRLAARYQQVRQFTEGLCTPLATEDYVVQSMPDVSPTKWHLAHTSWFFEAIHPGQGAKRQTTGRSMSGSGYLFNSYYLSDGSRAALPAEARARFHGRRCEEVYRYRELRGRAHAPGR